MDVLQICGDDVLKMILLASVGNFVASPSDPNISPQSSMKSMPSVVVDAYTGQFIMHTPYDAVRGYFVEALLVISIIVISRLTFVRNNTYNTVVHVNPSQGMHPGAFLSPAGGVTPHTAPAMVSKTL
jgi:hypothetical protein